MSLCSLCVFLGAAGLMTSCIDEDLSDCGYNYAVRYNMHVHIDINNTLQTELSDPDELAIRQQLGNALSPVFSDVVADLQMQFYDAADATAHYEEHIINSNSASYTIYLPVKQYRHHALANQQAEPLLTEHEAEASASHHLRREAADTIQTHAHGVFAGTLSMSGEVQDSVYYVNLYMVNCATALVVDLNGNSPDEMWAHASGFADRFAVDDSTYTYGASHAVVTQEISDGAERRAFYAVHLPSRDAAVGRADGDGLWQYDVVVRMNGSYTRSTLSVSTAVPAGALRVIKGKLTDKGEIVTDARDVGVSVALDWKPGGNHDVGID